MPAVISFHGNGGGGAQGRRVTLISGGATAVEGIGPLEKPDQPDRK